MATVIKMNNYTGKNAMKQTLILFLFLLASYPCSILGKAYPVLTSYKLQQRPTKKISRKSRNRNSNGSRIRRLNRNRNRTRNPQTPLIFSRTLSHFVIPSYKKDPASNSYTWEDKSPISFDELIISWNAKRPENGHITFWTSVKYGESWSPWHRMSTWGATQQRSFINKLHRLVHTKHVLIELQRKQKASAFRIKAVFHDGATIDNLHALFACCSQHQSFALKRVYENYPSYLIKGIPKISQMMLKHNRHQDICSSTSLSMVTAHFNKDPLAKNQYSRNQLHNYAVDFADNVHDYGIDIYGNWQLNAAEAYDACQGNVFFKVERLNSFDDLYNLIRQDIPVVVSVRKLKGGATPYENGHFLVVVGWNEQHRTVICHDPAFRGKIDRHYPINHFLHAWARSKNLSYIPIPKK